MIRNYASILAVFAAAFAVNALAPSILTLIGGLSGTEAPIAQSLWCLGLILGFGWLCSLASAGTIFPNFTVQLLVGIILHDALAPLSAQMLLAVVVCTALAAIILKSGGDEIDRRDFVKFAFPTVMIAVVGYLITFFIMFPILMALGLDGKTAALLAAIIGSTDPAALIPTLRQLSFKDEYKRVSGISVAESAVNDAVGAIFTAAIVAMILAGVDVSSVSGLSAGLVQPDNLIHLGNQFLFGIVAGLAGWGLMSLFERYKASRHRPDVAEPTYDFGMVLAVPLVTFFLAQTIHGNGFLAAFVAGLLANFNHGAEYFRGQLHTLETEIDSVAKPTIFMMVGPFVALSDLVETALLGLAISIIFMFVARPLAVLVSMLPTGLNMREKLFLCAVRETGVIPVVLAVITVAQLPELTSLMPLTAWVVIWTLTFLPAVTPWWARRLGVVDGQATSGAGANH